MTVLAGFSAAGRGAAPVELAAQIARTTGEPVVAAAVIERRLPARTDPIEDEYVDAVAVRTERALHAAVDGLPGAGVTVEVAQAQSIPRGLTDLAAKHAASVVTVGSSSAGLAGRVSLGAVTDRLVHAAAVPVAIAPRGYRSSGRPVTRLSAAYGGKADANGLIEAAAALAGAWDVPLRIVSFSVHGPGAMFGASVSDAAEELIVRRWQAAMSARIELRLGQARSTVSLADVEVAAGTGADWRAAVENASWQPGELLLLGSGAAGQAQQVFLGTAAARIVRNSPVPVMIVPRPEATERIA
ncbi:universal stress protein [Tsukamurella sp. 8F]|uniref:universal stress protein n=1 Tax=unclassified Tsukamurella TaxID=2633480 RepID=UPI0023B9DFAC|nr:MULTISPECIES: universal stress protein [unclassified Tsukamurella]MDF0529639.1 universal stress protein [Tsukamurella sp. 8J]MDF0585924.1 universal stress protein [Tsukamurella sp. 8F]